MGWRDFSLYRAPCTIRLLGDNQPPWFAWDGGGIPGMWDFSAKTSKVPGKPGQVGLPIAFSRATYTIELKDPNR